MKIKGYKPENPNIEVIVIPRGINEPIIFKAQAILDYEPFDKLCPRPTPPTILRSDGSKGIDVEDEKFLNKVREHCQYKSDWIAIQSLRATDDLEWETVDYSDPRTWHNYLNELKDFKLTDTEISIVLEAIQVVNGMDEEKLKAARKHFLASQGRESTKQFSQSFVQGITQSGEVVKDLG